MFEDFHKLFDNEVKPYILVGADLGATVIKFYTQMLREYIFFSCSFLVFEGDLVS